MFVKTVHQAGGHAFTWAHCLLPKALQHLGMNWTWLPRLNRSVFAIDVSVYRCIWCIQSLDGIAKNAECRFLCMLATQLSIYICMYVFLDSVELDAYKEKHTEMRSGLYSFPALHICSSRKKRHWTLSLFLGLHLLLFCTCSLWQEHLGSNREPQSSLEIERSKMYSHFWKSWHIRNQDYSKTKCSTGIETGRPGCCTESFWFWSGRFFSIKILSKTSMVRTTCYVLNKIIWNTSNQLPDYFSVWLSTPNNIF